MYVQSLKWWEIKNQAPAKNVKEKRGKMKSTLRRSTNLLISLVVLISMLFPGMQSNPASAQAQDDLHREYNAESGKVAFITGEGRTPISVLGANALGMTPEAQSLALVQRFAPEFGLTNPSKELRLSDTDQPTADRVVSKYQQVYQGVPVMAGELIVNASKRGELISLNGEVSQGLSLDTNPKLSVETAIEIAKKGMVKWYGGDAKDYRGTQASLWIFDETLLRPSLRPVELVWRIEMITEGTPIRELVLVDAKTGNVSLHFNQIDTAWASHNAGENKQVQNARSTEKSAQPDAASMNSSLSKIESFAVTGSIWYVATAGDDANDCATPATPCATFFNVMTKSNNGDTIFVEQGVYNNFYMDIAKSMTVFGGWDSSFTVQIGYTNFSGSAITVQSYAKIDHFVVENTPSVAITNNGSLTITNCEVRNNNGEGINNTGFISIDNCSIHDNGGGIRNYLGTGVITNSQIYDNVSLFYGGVSNYRGTLTINYSHIYRNTSTIDGGGIGNDSGSIEINNSAIYENNAGRYGGGIDMTGYGGTVAVNNTTISRNQAGDHGGGVSGGNFTYNSLTLKNVTISENYANSASAIYGNANLYNSIIANNLASDGKECSTGYSIRAIANNIIYNTNCTFQTQPGQISDYLNVNPKLSPFVPYTGVSPIAADSPAVNAGDPATCVGTTDQRGVSRVGICDIGAYEYTAPGIPFKIHVFSGDYQRGLPGMSFSKQFIALAVDANGTPVGANYPVTFSAPSGGASGTFLSNGTNEEVVLTSPAGFAASSFTANGQIGEYIVTASLSGSSLPATYHVGNGFWSVTPDGNNSNNCLSKLTPCATISGVMAKQNFYDGDHIRLLAGSYNTFGKVDLYNSATVSGGWNSTFSTQIGTSAILEIFHIYLLGNAVLERLVIGSSGSSLPYEAIINDGSVLFQDGAVINNQGITNQNLMTIRNSTISGNTNLGNGGGIRSKGNTGNTTVINSTISSNTGAQGGGIFSVGPNLKIINSTITNNTATIQGSGGIESFGANTVISNSILVGNYSIQASNEYAFNTDCRGTFTSLGHNLVGNIGTKYPNTNLYPCNPVFMGSDLWGDALNPIPASIVLDPPTDIGGGIMMHPLHFGSPAIDAGNPITPGSSISQACPATDQRGIPRPQASVCDIGAFEYVFESSLFSPLIRTYDMGNATTLPGTKVCDEADWSCPGGDAEARNAHLFAKDLYDLNQTKHNRISLDGKGIEILSTTNYGVNYGNAYWNGYMAIFGDGFANADDVVAHELTHGITQYESDLFYFYQSGAINESFSDVWGEYYDQINGFGTDTLPAKWLIGEDVSGSTPIRSMSNPPVYGDPDKMTSVNYNITDLDNGGVHTNSGVNNKAVFLMVEGGTFNGKTVSALGWDKTEAIYYEVQTNLLSSGSDYSDLYYAVQQACANLTGQLGITATDCLQLKNALDAVEMNSQPVSNFNPDAPVCAAGTYKEPVFLDNLENGTNQWVLTDGWSLAKGFASSPSQMLNGYDFLPSTEASAEFAVSVPVPISSNIYLHFKHAFAFEYDISGNYDGGVLEYSINNGVTWVDASPLYADGQNYKGLISNYSGTTNTLKGRNAFVGDSHGYVSSRYNLTSLGGKTVKFRWRFATDNNYYYLGWMVDDVQIYSCDATLPVVTSIVRANFNPNNLTTVQYTVNFSRSVTGVDISDFTLATSGVSGAAVSGIGGSGSIYTVIVNTGSGDGAIRLDLVDNNSIIDASSIPLGGAGAGDGSFTSGQTYTITKSLGRDTAGVFRPSNGLLYLKNAHISGFADVAINYGLSGDYPVTGDWNGDGIDTIGIYRNGSFYLRNSNTLGFADIVFAFGQPGDQPVAGDWDGNGVDTIGIYRNGLFLLRNSNSAGAEDISFYLGNPGDVGIAGDWNGDGADTTGVFRPSNGVIFLKNLNTSGFADININYGLSGDMPVTGDWNNDGIDTIGVYRNAQFLLRNSNTIGFADIVFALGNPGDMPIAGNWDALP